MEASEAFIVVRAVNSDVLFGELFESVHELKEVFLASDFAEVIGGEVGVHA